MNLTDTVSGCEPVGLEQVVECARLDRRVDRKYLVPVPVAARLVADLQPSHRVLQIGERRTTTYRTVYFDSEDLQCCRAHLQGRRLRWKVRQRLYVDDALCRLELKRSAGRGETVKHAVPQQLHEYSMVDDGVRSRLVDLLAACGVPATAAPALRPVVEVVYRRITLVDLRAGTRVTIDRDLTARALPTAGTSLREDRVVLDPGYVIVETKGQARPAPVDRLLLAAGQRDTALSKYATSAAFLSSRVPDNLVRHHRRRHLHVVAAGTG